MPVLTPQNHIDITSPEDNAITVYWLLNVLICHAVSVIIRYKNNYNNVTSFSVREVRPINELFRPHDYICLVVCLNVL
jgi:hypothetical protein